MPSINDRAFISSLVADVMHRETVQTTDATPATVRSYQMTGAELIDIEVICHAMAVSGGFVSRMAKTFFYDGGTITEGGYWGYVTREYLGTGLTSCDFSFLVAGDTISVVWTGEVGTNITAMFRIYINRLFDDSLLPP